MYEAIDVSLWDRQHLEHYLVHDAARIFLAHAEALNRALIKEGRPAGINQNHIKRYNHFFTYARNAIYNSCKEFMIKVQLTPTEKPDFLSRLGFGAPQRPFIKLMTIENMLMEVKNWISDQYKHDWFPDVYDNYDQAKERAIEEGLPLIETNDMIVRIVQEIYYHSQQKSAA